MIDNLDKPVLEAIKAEGGSEVTTLALWDRLYTTGTRCSLYRLFKVLDLLEDRGLVHSRYDGATPERGGRHARYVSVVNNAMSKV
jgi:hypothetical protein